MAEEVWLDAPFAALWKDADVFARVSALKGESHREIEHRVTLSFFVAGKRYFVKRHRGTTWKEVFKNLLQARLPVVSAHNEWVALSRLSALQVQVPKVVGYGRRGKLPSSFESFLITEDVGPHVTLEDYCRHWSIQVPAFTDKLELIAEVARITRTMHSAGICHRDYYICHFLRMENGGITLIDLHRALNKQQLGTRWIIKDLASLYFSSLDAGLTARDLLRFIRQYTQMPLREAMVHQRFWAAVRARGIKLYQKD